MLDDGLREGTILSTFPCAKDSYSITTKMHNTFVKDMISTESTTLKVISVAKHIF